MQRVSPRKLRRAVSTQPTPRNRRPRPLGVSLGRFASAVAIAGTLFAGVGSATAADRFWDPFFSGTATGGGVGIWDHLSTANWWDGAGLVQWKNGQFDAAIFGGSTAGTVTLSGALTAGGVTFNTSGYALASGTLTLHPPAGATSSLIAVNGIDARAGIDSILAGTSGFTKTGAGTLLLTNTANTFSGDIAIKDGVLTITDADQLGSGTTAVSVTGVAQAGNPGFSGGSLLLAGSTTAAGTGLNLGREVSIAGRGPNVVNNTGGLVSVGNITLSGGLTLGSTAGENRVWATHGTTTISGGVNLGAAGQSQVFQGNGNWTISGVVTGSENANDRFIKSGQLIGTTLWLQNAGNTFTDSIRIDSGTVRVGEVGALGLNIGNQSLDLQNGSFEIRTDAAAGFATKSLIQRSNTSGNIFVDHAISGGLGIGTNLQAQTVTFAGFRSNLGSAQTATFAINGRNGYGASFTAPAFGNVSLGDGNLTVNVNTNGLVTFNGDFQFINSGTARTLTFGGNGDTLVTGSFTPSGTGAHAFTKGGIGTLTINGTDGTYTGATNITAGTLAFSDVGAFANSSQINIGNATTTSGALTYLGGAGTLSKNLLLNTTTANAYLNASGTGPLTVNGNILTTVNGAKTLVLGGTSGDENTIASIFANSGTNVHSLQKIGAGTWVLAGAANNTFTGSTTVSGGTLKLQEAAGNFDALPNAGAVNFNVDSFTQAAGGNLTYLGADSSTSTESVGALTLTAGGSTLTLTPGAGGGAAALTFASLSTPSAGTGLNISAAESAVTLTGVATSTATTLPGNGHIYINGINFARSSGGALVTPAYDTDTGFVTAGAALTPGNHNLVAAGTISGALAISSLKISGGQTVDQTGLLTINVGANTSGGILQTGGSATISGTGVTTGGSGDLVIRVNGGSDQLTMSAPITSTTTGGVTKNGTGNLLLQGAQAYTGATTINEGKITLDAGSRLGGATASNNNNLTVRQNGTLDINGNNIGIAAFNGAGLVTNGGPAATLTIGNNNQSGVFSGSITGALGISKAGTGTTISLTGLNTFTGATTITSGSLVVNNLANIGAASGIGAGDPTDDTSNAASLVFGGGTLVYTGANGQLYQTTQTPSISTNRLFTLAGNGTIDSSGSFGAPTLTHSANSASLIFSNTAPVAFSGTGARTLTLQGDSSGDNTMRLQLVNNESDPLSLTKAAGGLWILNPGISNAYTGTTTISGGALRVAAEGAAVQGLSTTSPLVINGGVLDTSGTFTRTLGAPVAGTGTVQLPGGSSGFSAATPDRLVVTIGSGTLTWGTTDFNPSSLVLGSSNALGETEITNDIAIGAAARTITVNNNGNTGAMVTAGILSGVISGAGTGDNAVIKNGGGVLMLGNANTYTGSTRVDSGNVIVTSIGTGVSSSLGASGALIYNPSNADLNGLVYVGSGETANRDLSLQSGSNFTANRTDRIDSSGTGALVWNTGTFIHTTRGDTVARVLTLELRGANTDGNQMNLVLTNSTNATFANVLHIAKNDGGVWILNPASANTFTGNINANGGLLGLTDNGIGAAAALVFSNGGIFGYGGALTTSKPVTLASNTAAVFAGTNAITLNGLITGASGNPWTISNNLEGGAILTINGDFLNADSTTNARSLNFRGLGSTVITGNIQNSTGTSVTNLDIRLADNTTVTLSGGTASTYTGTTLLGQGTLILNKAPGVAQFGASSQFVFDGGSLQAAFPLTGADKINTRVTLAGDQATVIGSNGIEFGATTALVNSGGNRFLRNELTGGATLTITGAVSLSESNTARTLTVRGSAPVTISGVVGNGGTGAGGLAYSGLGTLSLTAANTATGALTVNRNNIVLTGADGSWAGSVVVNPIGTVTLDNASVEANRLADGGAFTGQGGILDFIGDADGTSETTGALTLNSVQSYINMSGAGPNVLTFASVNFANSGSSLNLAGVPTLGTTNKVRFTAALAANAQINGVMPRTFISGGTFATCDVTNGVQAFTNYNPTSTTDINLASATDTVDVNGGMTTTALIANETINALRLNGSGLSVSGANRKLTVTSGAVLNTGGDNSLDTAAVAFTTNTPFIQVDTGTTLQVNSALIGTVNFAKSLPGTLQINTPTFLAGTQNILRGTVKLNGGLNTMFPGQLTNINEGSVLDLNGNAQLVGQLSDPGVLPESGGLITSSIGIGLLVASSGASSAVATNINGSLNFGKAGSNTITLESVNTYSGTTTLLGGTLQLQNDATILNTSSISINDATLLLNNNSSLQRAVYDRIGNTTPITLRDGTISFTGKVSDPATETFGAVTSAQGANTITANTGGTGTAGALSSVDLTFASLTRNAGTTVNFTGTGLGQQGNNSRVVFTSPLTTNANGALGAWAISNSTDYAAYNTGTGIGIVGQGGFTGYSGTFAPGEITEVPATANSVTVLPGGTTTTGMLKISGAFTNNIAFANNADVLNLEQGGLLRSNNSNGTSIGTTAVRGFITSGTSELVIYDNASGTSTSAATATTAVGSNVITTVPSTVGLEPGMTITTANLPAGTYIVSVDGPDQITVSQNATAVGTTNALVFGVSNLVVNSVIQGAGTMLMKAGGGALNLSANNTYMGGTTILQGTVNLIGSGVVIPAGGVILGGASMNLLTNSGQIDPSNSITLRRSSVLTLAGSNTLDSLIFDNNGGTSNPTVAIPAGQTLTLTNSSPVSVTTNNAATTPIIFGGTLALGAGVNLLNIGDININGTTYTRIQPSLNISSIISGASSSITKTGDGFLQLSGQSTFNGLNLTSGGILISGNSTPTSGGAGFTGGPLGAGTVSAAAGTAFLVDGSRTVGNDITFAGTPRFDSTANTAWTLTLNGTLTAPTFATATPTIQVTNPFLTVAILGNIPNIASITSFNRTGLGTLIFNSTGYTGNYDAAALGNGLAVSLLHDGTAPNIGNGVVETIGLGSVAFDAIGTGTVTVGRAGGSLPLSLAANKIIAPSSINTVLTNGLTVANNNGYGLQVADAGALVNSPTFTVNNTTASNVTQGLYLTGALTGTGFIKTGNGTVVLGNAGNGYTGDIDIRTGVVSVDSDAHLGAGANHILLNPTTGTSTLRATGTFVTSRVIELATASNTRAIEVTGGNTLTLNTGFGLTAATAGLVKAERGTLELTAANIGWSGELTISGGAVRTALASSLGSGEITVNNPGAALQLQGITVANPITIDVLANGQIVTGIDTGGVIQGVSGSSIVSNTITVNAQPNADNQTRSFGFAADSGASLTLDDINFNHVAGTGRNVIAFLGGEGSLTLGGVINNTTTGTLGSSFVFKYGSGTMTVTAASAMPDSEVRVYRGGLALNGAGTFGTSALQAQVWQNGTLTLDNSTTNTANRLGSNRVLQMGGGLLDVIPNAAGSSHVSTGALQISQGSNTINLGAGGNLTLTFASLTQNGGSTLNLTGTFGSITNKLTFTTAPTLSPAGTGLLARVLTNGNEFATYSASTGIGTFTGYAAATNILSVGATQTYNATDVTANSLTGNQILNALKLTSGGASTNVGGLSGLNPTTLVVTSGGILADGAGAGSTLSVPVVSFGATGTSEAMFHVLSGQTLDVSSGLVTSGGMTKSSGGTLNFSSQQFVSGNTYVNAGTLNLNPGATNTLLFNNGLGVNGGATVDLKNGVQFIGSLFSANGGGNTDLGGGTVTNSGAEATLVTNSNSSFNGQITGSIFLNKTGTGALNLQNANTYTGATLLNGGTTTLQDQGTLSGTTSIYIIRANLTLTNNNLYSLGDRVNDLAPITLSGASISMNGRAQSDTSETLGQVTLVDGHNGIFPTLIGTGINTNTLNLGGLSRSVGSTATLRFNSLGSIGLIGNSNYVLVSGGVPLTNNIVGPWAIVDREYATYDNAYGINALGQTGMAGYAGSGLNTNPLATDNVRHTATGTTVLSADAVMNTLNLSQSTNNMILDLGSKTLRLQGGGLLIGQNTDNTSVTITNGTITSGAVGSPSDFYVIHAPFDSDGRPATIDAAIADNAPVTGPVRLILSAGDARPAASGLTLGGVNTYTGGTVINQSTVALGATGSLGSGGLTVHGATFIQTAGGVIPTQALTMTGGSTVTLANQANSLSDITFNSNGGAAPTLNPTGTLTLTGGITSTPTAAGAIATMTNGILDLNGANSYSIDVAATIVNGHDVAPWQSGLTINSVIENGGITKSGAGLLQLGGQSTFAGGVNVTAGGLILGASSTPSGLLDAVLTGPLGTGAVTMAASTTLVATVAASVSNNFTFLGDTVFNGVQNITLNGITTLPSVWNATVTAPQMTVTIGDASPSLATDEINKSGLGILVVGNYAGTINATGGLLFSADGNTLGTSENISLGGGLVISGDTAITVNRSGSAPNARNKSLQKTTLAVPGNIMSVSNQSGFGLEFTGATTMTGPSHFAVSVATPSNVVPGLILSGVVDDGASNFDLTKSGPGTLVLTNAGNTFGGAGKTVDILNGVLAVGSDGALGVAANTVTLNVDAATGVGLRATGSFSTGRTIILNQANNAIEVTTGNALVLTAPLNVTTNTNTLTKNDNGMLVLAAANPASWTGGVIINSGAVIVVDSGAFGASTAPIMISPSASATGAALQLNGGILLANPVNLQGVNNVAFGGINFGGQLESRAGANSVTGQIRMDFDAAIGATGGASLDINGGIHNATASARALLFNVDAGGAINLNSNLTSATATANQYFAVRKYGAGVLNFTTANTVVPTTDITVHGGTLSLNADGKLTGGATVAANVNSGGTLDITDNSASPIANRLGGRPVTLQGGSFNYQGSMTGDSTETAGILTITRPGGTITTNAGGANNSVVTFASLTQNADSAFNFTGSSLGTSTNKILFTTAPTLVGGAVAATNGILARGTVDGSTFATYNTNGLATNNNGIQAFTGYNFTSTTNINAAAATDTVDANPMMPTKNLTASKTLNGLRISGATDQTVGGAPLNVLTLTSGGLLATGGVNHTISVPVVAVGTVQEIFHIDASTTLEITSVLTGTAGWVKDGSGTLILTPPTTPILNRSGNTITGNASILEGVVRLKGGNNTLPANQNLLVGLGGTLDLNGNAQYVGILFTDFVATENGGGTITGGALPGSTLTINQGAADRNWSGQMTGAMSFLRTGANTLSMYSNNDYTGHTLIAGGATTLRDSGRLSGTSDIEITYATLNLDNNVGTRNDFDRVNDLAPITLRGGTLSLIGRAQTASTETVGDVTIRRGMSTITSAVGGTGINSAELNMAGFDQEGGNGATVLFSSNLGLIGSSNRIIINSLNGNAAANTTVGAGLTNNLIGGWAVTGNSEFATYIPGLGVASLNQVGAPQYDRNNTFAAAMATDNVRLSSTTTVTSGGVTVNAVSMSGSNIALNFAAGSDILNIVSGGLIGPNNNQTIGTTALRGILTAGGNAISGTSELYLYNRANTLTVNSRIVDTATAIGSGTGNVRLVLTAAGGAITLGNGTNSHTGGTTVNGGTVNLNAMTGSIVIPAATNPVNGLVINGGTVTMQNTAGQIDPSNIVTINGNSTLNLFGSNTLAGVIFRDDGGGTSASQIVSNAGILSIEGNVVSTTANPASVSTLAGRVDFGTTQRTLDISATMFNGQELAALLADFNLQGVVGSAGGIVKEGDGVLQFNGVDIYTGPTIVTEGRIQIGTTNGGSRFSAYSLTSGTSLNLNGLSTILGSLEGAGQVVNSSAATGTLTVGFNGNSATYSGSFNRFNDAAPSPINLTKIGVGTLTLTGNASTSGGVLTINRGGVTYKDSGVRNFTGTTQVNEGGTLTLDNSNANSTLNVVNRLGGTGGLALNGGIFNVIGRDATNTTETVNSALTLGPSASAINLTAGGSGGTVTVTFSSLSQSANGTASISGTNLGTDTILKFTTAPTLVPATTGILPRIAIGADFATYTPTNGIIAFNGYTTPANINAAPGTSTIKVDATTLIRDLTEARTINGLNIIDDGVNIGASGALLPAQGWTITSGGVLVNGNNTTISTPVLALGAEGIFRVNGSSLNVTGSITGTAGLTKTGTGTMTLGSPQSYTGTTGLNRGTLILAGGNNTLLVGPTGSIPTVADLQVNGGLLDLNGNNQAVRTLLDSNTLAFIDSEITNSSSTAVTFTTAMNASTPFGGKLTGNLGLTRSGNNTLTLVDEQTYSGPTIIRGGNLTLQDRGSLATSAITLHFGALTLSNNNLNPLTALDPERIAATTPITMQGGSFIVTPGGSVDNTTTLNSVTILPGGANTITPNGVTGGTNTIHIGSLILPANTGTTLHFNTDPGQPTTSGAQVFLTQLNGATPVNNSFLGANVILNNGEYGAYVTTQGVGRFGATGFPAYAAALASGNNLPANVSSTGADVSIAANTTIGALRMTGGATRAITFTAGANVLNLALGGLLRSNEAFALNVGTTSLRGVLTAGGTATSGITDLVTFHNQSTMTINSVIADNGLGGQVRLVKSGPAGLTLTAANTYTGGTVVNQGTLTINATAGAGTVVIPGDLTLNNAALVMSTNQGQIDPASNVTFNGDGDLTLIGTNTLNSFTFNNTGGNGTATAAVGTQLTLSSLTPITVSNDNYSFTPTISGTLLTLQDGAAISTSGLSPSDLIISARISTVAATAPLEKTGSGSLILSSTSSNFANGFNLNQGSLIFASSSTGTPPAVSAGPVGTGTLSLADGVAIQSDGTARTVGNAVNVAGNFTFGTPATASSRANAGNNLTLSGIVTLAAGAHTIDVGGLLMTGTISGQLTGGTNLTKAGPGTLVLGNAGNNYGGATTVSAGTLQLGAAGAIPDGSAVTIASGAALNTNGISEAIGSLAGSGLVTNATGGAAVLTTGGNDASTLFSGVIAEGTGSLGIAKTGSGTLTLSGANTYTGPTTITSGTLELSGSIAGTTGVTSTSAVQVDGTGTLLLSGANEQINNSATVTLNGGTLAFGSQSGVAETLGALTLNANSILDFGIGDSNTFSFSGLSITGGSILSIYNWTGTPYFFPPEDDTVGNGHLATQDRLLLSGDASLQPLTQIRFYADGAGVNFLGDGAQIIFGGGFEIVPVPEPSSTALLGAAGLLALVGYRERRRLSRKNKQA